MPAKLLRPNVGIYVAHSSVFPNGITGTSTITLDQVTTLGTFTNKVLTAGVVNISSAVTDDYTLGLTDSQSDNSLSVVDNANVVTPTYSNYAASFDGFRDSSNTATSVYNDFKNLFQAADNKYYLIKRIGKPHSDPFAIGDIVSVFGVLTDFGQDIYGDGQMIRLGARFLTTGEVLTNASILSGIPSTGPLVQSTVGTKVMSNGRMRVWWIPSGTLTNTETDLFATGPKLAEFSKSTTVDLTEAIAWDSFALGAQDSNKVDDRSIIDTGAVQNRGFAQFDAGLNFFRAKFPTAVTLATGTINTNTITLRSGALTVTTGAISTSTLEITTANKGDKIKVGMKVLNVAGVIGLSNNVVGTISTNVFTATTAADVLNVKVGMKATATAGGTGTATVTAVNGANITLSTTIAGVTAMNFSTDVFVSSVNTSGSNPIITLSTPHFGAVTAATFTVDTTKLEIGMSVSGTGVGTGATITAINTTTDVITVSVNNSAAVTVDNAVTITNSYALAYDTFKASTGSTKPTGYLVVRTNVAVATAVAANDEVNVFKFTADATMDNTSGEDSFKFMVNFMPQGLMALVRKVQS